MTNYNERLDEAIKGAVAPAWLQQVHKTTNVPAYQLHVHEAKQALTSLIKELVAEARTDELKHLVYDDGIWYEDMTRQFPQKMTLNQRIKELEALSYNNHTMPEVIASITADRKRVALEARIHEIGLMQHQARINLKTSNAVAGWGDIRIAELKAQQEEV